MCLRAYTASMGKAKSALALVGRVINEAVSFIVFSVLDLVDFLLCFLYRVADFFIEAEWKPCYCSSSKEAITSSGKILVSEQGESKIVCLSSTKLQLEEISDTLYTRPSLLSEVSKLTMKETKKGTVRSTFTVNSTIVEMLQGKIGGQQCHPIPRWSDCDCKFCTSWTSNSKETLYVRTEGPKGKIIFSFSQNIYHKICICDLFLHAISDYKAQEDVLFIHGFISSSAFWTETLFPNFSSAAKSSFRLFAIDLLGFGRSPKPTDSMYTLREHLEMIERSVLEPNKVKSFHIVAHSLGCILALALAVKYPLSIKSLTLLAPVSSTSWLWPLPKFLKTKYFPLVCFSCRDVMLDHI